MTQQLMAGKDAEAAVEPKKLDSFSFRTVIILHAAAIALFAFGTLAGHRESSKIPSCLTFMSRPLCMHQAN